MEARERNVRWHQPSVTVEDRRDQYDYRSCVIWFTGLPASGKSTLANALCRELHARRIMSYVLDGDNIRHGLNSDLGFGPEDRKENIRRIGEVTKLFVDAGLIVLTAFISPYRSDRLRVRRMLPEGDFIEVFVNCDLAACERRDPKGMYEKARKGLIREYTGISAPYERPEDPEIVLETSVLSVEECLDRLMDYLIDNGYIQPSRSQSESGNGR